MSVYIKNKIRRIEQTTIRLFLVIRPGDLIVTEDGLQHLYRHRMICFSKSLKRKEKQKAIAITNWNHDHLNVNVSPGAQSIN